MQESFIHVIRAMPHTSIDGGIEHSVFLEVHLHSNQENLE